MRNLAIIPARGGSKRIPRKNIKEFLGKPVITYSIETALQSELFDEVMVSTDDERIAAIAKQAGAAVPFMRSKATSRDNSSTADVLAEVISAYAGRKHEVDVFFCIYPTAPLLTPERLRQAHAALISSRADSVFPIVRFSYPIWRGMRIEGRYARMIWPVNLNRRSQDLPAAYHDAGQFYAMRSMTLARENKLFTKKSIGIEISELEAQDIDTETDWVLAEMKYKLLNRRK